MVGLNRLEIFTVTVIFFTLSTNECWSQALSQKVTIHRDKDNCQGSAVIYTEKDEPRLPYYWNDRAISAQVKGVWLFYEHENYNEAQEGLMEYSFLTCSCLNFNNFAWKLTSFRFAGSPKNYTASTLTLYKGIYFQGQDEFTTVDRSHLNLDKIASSFIITGSGPWTLYDFPSFEGNSVCIRPNQSTNLKPVFVPDAKIVITPNQHIRSVKQGCFSSQIIWV